MKWLRFTHQDRNYDLSHLDPFEWRYTVEADGKRPESAYHFQVTFSLHCFTSKPFPSEEVSEDLWYEGPKERRVFCFERYELSRQLPAIVRTLGDRSCWHTACSGFLTIELINEGEKVEYEVYFRVTRARSLSDLAESAAKAVNRCLFSANPR